MATVPNLHRIRRHFVRQHAWQSVDVQHIVVYYNHPFHRVRDVNGHDVIIIQSIRPHRLSSLMESGDQQVDHLLTLVVMVRDIMLAPNSFVIVEIIPRKFGKLG